MAPQFPDLKCVAYCTTFPAENGVKDYLRRVLREVADTGLSFHFAGRVFADAESPADCINLHGDGQSLIGALLST